MGLTLGNVIFDILEPPTLKKIQQFKHFSVILVTCIVQLDLSMLNTSAPLQHINDEAIDSIISYISSQNLQVQPFKQWIRQDRSHRLLLRLLLLLAVLHPVCDGFTWCQLGIKSYFGPRSLPVGVSILCYNTVIL